MCISRNRYDGKKAAEAGMVHATYPMGPPTTAPIRRDGKGLFIHYMLSSCLSFVSPLLFPFSSAVTFILLLILYEAMEYKRRKWRREVKHFLVHSRNFGKNLMVYSLSFFFPIYAGHVQDNSERSWRRRSWIC